MAELFPHIEPYKFGLLEVSNIHKIYWEKVGNIKGVPILVLHGGPGAGDPPRRLRGGRVQLPRHAPARD